jgi:hypothetical protein
MGDAQLSTVIDCEESHMSGRQHSSNAATDSCLVNEISSRISDGNKKSVEDSYVLSLDVGTTTIRAHVYDQNTSKRGSGSRKVTLHITINSL